MPPLLPLNNLDAAILVGGMGTRLRGVVDDIPKPLAPVLGRPFLFYQLDMLALRGARSVTLCCGYKAELVQESVGSDWLGMPINYSVETEPLGTGGALRLARHTLKSANILVLNGDSWLEPDWAGFVQSAGDVHGDSFIALVEVANSGRFGVVEMNNGLISNFKEKCSTSYSSVINGGVYFFPQEAVNSLPRIPHSLEKDVFPSLASQKRLRGIISRSQFLDIGIPASYSSAGDFLTRLGVAPHSMFPDNPQMDQALPKLGTCVVIFDDAGRVLLEHRADCEWWGLPGGALDAGETLTQGAAREVLEETGLSIEIERLLGVFSDPKRRTVRYPDAGDLRQLVDAVCIARPTGGHLRVSEESLDLEWFAPSKLPLNTVPPVVEILRHAFAPSQTAVLR